MFQKLLILIILISCSLTSFASSHWTGGDGDKPSNRFESVSTTTSDVFLATRRWIGGDGNWSDASNWSGGVPNSNDSANFDGDGGGQGASNSSNDLPGGPVPICIDLEGATITLSKVVIRDSANITFKNGNIIANNNRGLTIANASSLTLKNGNYEFGKVLVHNPSSPYKNSGHLGSSLNVDCDAMMTVTFPDDALETENHTGITVAGSDPMNTLTNCGNIIVESKFLKGIEINGSLDNSVDGKIEIKNGTFPGAKSCGLCVGETDNQGGIINNRGDIIVRIGFVQGTQVAAGGIFNNLGPCSMLSTTSGRTNKGLVIQGNETGDTPDTDSGDFINEGTMITDNNGPICNNNGLTPDAEFIVCTDDMNKQITYSIDGGSNVTVTLDEEKNRTVGGGGGVIGVTTKTTYCKTIITSMPTTDANLEVKSITGCASLDCAKSVVERVTLADVTVDKLVPDVVIELPCGDSLDLDCVFLGAPHGGAYKYYNSQADLDNGNDQGTGAVFNDIEASKEIFVVYDINGGCTDTASINVTITNPAVNLTIQNLEISSGNSVDLSTGVTESTASAGRETLSYYLTQTDAVDSTNALSSSMVNAAGTYYVRYEVDNGIEDKEDGCIVIEPIVVSFATSSVTLTDPADVCIDGADLNFTAAPTGGTFTSTALAAAFNSDGAAGTANIDVSAAGAGTYSVTYEYTDGSDTTVSVTINPLPICNISGSTIAVTNSQDGIYSGPTGMSSYLWSVMSGDASIDGANDEQMVTIDFGTANSTLKLDIVDANGCSSSCMINITMTSSLTCMISGIASTCSNTTGLIFTGIPGATTYSWSVLSGDATINGATNIQMITVNAGSSDFILQLVISPGTITTCTKNVTVNALPTMTLTDPADVCIGGADFSFAATPVGGTFTSTAPTASFSSDGAAGIASIDVSVADEGTYSVIYEYTDGAGCKNDTMVSVTVNALPTMTLTDPTDVCIDGTDLNFTATPAGGTFTSTAPVASFSSNGVAGTASIDVGTSGAGTYSVTYEYTDGAGCKNDTTVSVTVNSLPICSISGSAIAVENSQDAIYSGPTGMSTYSWSVLSGDATVDGATNTQNVSIDFGVANSILKLVITNAAGCSSTCMLTVNMTSSLSCNITGVSSICDNTSDLVFTGIAGASSYNWSIINGDAVVDGANNGQTVTVDAVNTDFTLQLVISPGSIRTCTKTVTVTSGCISPVFTYSITDPCRCDNPNNITLPDGTILFADVLTVDASQFVAPTVTLAATDANYFDNTGASIPATAAVFTDLGGGIYTSVFYTRTNMPATVTIDVNGKQEQLMTDSCTPCVTPEPIPTMSE